MEYKVLDITGLVTNTKLDRKVTEIKNKIPDTTGW